MSGPRWVCAAAAILVVAACGDAAVEVQEAEAAAPSSPRHEQVASDQEVVRIEAKDGSVVELLESGTGRAARLGDRVLVQLHGTVAESETVVTSTRESGIPRSFVLGRDRLIPGLERRLLGMRAGTRAVLHIPSAEAYGEAGMGSIPGGADLVFDVHLITVEPTR